MAIRNSFRIRNHEAIELLQQGQSSQPTQLYREILAALRDQMSRHQEQEELLIGAQKELVGHEHESVGCQASQPIRSIPLRRPCNHSESCDCDFELYNKAFDIIDDENIIAGKYNIQDIFTADSCVTLFNMGLAYHRQYLALCSNATSPMQIPRNELNKEEGLQTCLRFYRLSLALVEDLDDEETGLADVLALLKVAILVNLCQILRHFWRREEIASFQEQATSVLLSVASKGRHLIPSDDYSFFVAVLLYSSQLEVAPAPAA